MFNKKPFVKWAGGKRQIISTLKKFIPEKYNVYYEPFIGGGALLFELSPKSAVINDYNSDLINVYSCIKNKNDYNKLCKELDLYEKNHNESFYYEIRNQDRNKMDFEKLPNYKKAARMIYLNKSCFNGLYRVNKKNEFNVPFNKKNKVNTYEKENLDGIHFYLNSNNIKILNGDFEKALKTAKKGDLVYLDPPYDSDTTTFTGYTDSGFSKKEQKRLSKVFIDLDQRGCYVILSNHNTKLINELYKDFNISVISAKRNINSNGKNRGKVEEVIITNFKNVSE